MVARMNGTALIRAATTADAPAIQAIYAPVVERTAISFEETPPSVAEMAARITATMQDYPYLVAELDGEVAGYAYASQHRTRAAYRTSVDVTVYIAEWARRRGVGRALYGKLLPALAKRGFHAAFAGIALPNEGSIALHESMGFTPLGIYHEVGRKFGNWHDVSWWQRLL
ncbi:N-acetyltransferase GCN5 [Sphingomonas sp. LH128]|uniref:arsinothricin resistance N-acetyltransferase ArsN1 family B n=1 Tax=Sphingomonas sp. LH128 TaxID=473781 RepID=UPI00027CBC55|nr:arsinothricin resistance N-acetyltransferase ArsN1 family B [Sphingomonas sp. LH128]EJU12018.1 N-acetyltransferase GCN5 [Sphingomonas sp. LH128]